VNERLFAIEARRARLLERAARERGDVAVALQALAPPLGFIDRCVGVVRYVIVRPPLVAGIVLALAVLRPRGVFKWARRAFGAWQSYRWLTRKAVA
jgi:hypothetical protein